MEIIAVNERTTDLIEQLINVWERSVKATHLFLFIQEIKEIEKYIPQALTDIAHLVIVTNENNFPAAFMGVENGKLEMLFVSPEERGEGLGKRLIRYGIKNYSISEVTVNEQNPRAIGFYEYIGFKTYKRADNDEKGMPYPLLYMRLEK